MQDKKGDRQMINLGSHQLPINAATKTFALLAKRGAGKSYTGAVMAEELFKNNIPFIVFDPIDVWWGLRFKEDGKSKGLPIVVFGLENADIKLDKDMGRRIAQSIVKHNISCVISVFGMPKSQQRFLITELAEELLKINNTPRHIFIEEAHEFVPQRVMGDMGKVFNAVSNLVIMGRNRGLGVTLINQRAATINKDVLTQLDTLLAFRNVSPQDRKALQEWVEYHAAEGDFEAFMKSLPSLPTGEGWIWSPEFLNIFERIKIRKRETFHPDREKLGQNFEMPSLENIDVKQFIEEFSKTGQTKGEVKRTVEKKEVESSPAIDSLNIQINKIKNEYESKLMQKDIEIRNLNKIIDNIRSIVGTPEVVIKSASKNGNLKIWLDKFGDSGEGKILQILAENSPNSFTRQQLVLMTSFKYSTTAEYISRLKRALVIKEEGGKVFINPEL